MCTLAYEVYQQKKLEKAKVASDDTLATTTDQIKTIDIKPYKNDVDWFMKKTLESMAETTKFDAKLDAKYQTKYQIFTVTKSEILALQNCSKVEF